MVYLFIFYFFYVTVVSTLNYNFVIFQIYLLIYLL